MNGPPPQPATPDLRQENQLLQDFLFRQQSDIDRLQAARRMVWILACVGWILLAVCALGWLR